MKINMNKDFLSEYKNEIWKGFDAKEMISIVVGLGCAGITAFIGYKFLKLPVNMLAYVAFPMMLPSLILGFVQGQGRMSLIQYLKEWQYTSKTDKLICSTESEIDQKRGHYFTMKQEEKDGI